MSGSPGLLAITFFVGVSKDDADSWLKEMGLVVKSFFADRGGRLHAVVSVPVGQETAYRRLIAASAFVEDVHQETQYDID